MPAQILLIDDSPLITTGIQEELKRLSDNYLVIDIAANFYEAEELLKQNEYNVICLDLNMPSIRGQKCFNELNGTTLNGWLFLKHYIFKEDAPYKNICKNSKFFVFSGYIEELKNHIRMSGVAQVDEKTWFSLLTLVPKGTGVYEELVQSILKSLRL